MIETHEGAALIATISAAVTTSLGILLCVITLRRQGPATMMSMSILLAATLVTCAAMTWTGSTGGKIRHTEVRGTTMFAPSTDD